MKDKTTNEYILEYNPESTDEAHKAAFSIVFCDDMKYELPYESIQAGFKVASMRLLSAVQAEQSSKAALALENDRLRREALKHHDEAAIMQARLDRLKEYAERNGYSIESAV